MSYSHRRFSRGLRALGSHAGFLFVVGVAFLATDVGCGTTGSNQVFSYVVQGDTQNWAFSSTTADNWKQLHRVLCKQGVSRILATGDIVDTWNDPAQWARADAVYDITDACGLPATLPAGNHDISAGTTPSFGYYDAFLRQRPLHRPLARSSTGHSWVDRLEAGLVVAVLPFQPSTAETSWVESWIGSHPSERVLLIQHDGVYPATGALLGGAGVLKKRFGSRIVGVIGGHFLPDDRVSGRSSSSGFTLFSNYQLGASLGYRPEGLVTMLDHYLATDTWCIRTINYLTGETNRFESAHCL